MTDSEAFQLLSQLYRDGSEAFERYNYCEAIRIWEEILDASPSWDKGRLHRALAEAYQEVGEFEKARIKYLEALSYDSEDADTRDAYAHFLWKHGDPRLALDQYILLAATYRRQHAPSEWIESLMVPLRDLGLRLGQSEQDLRARLLLTAGKSTG
jgi:Tfp pilus assembly protein PilF